MRTDRASSHPAAATEQGADQGAADQALLRRYFRAVFGDQATGDRLAAALSPLRTRGAAAGPRGEAAVLRSALRRWRRLHGEPGTGTAFAASSIPRALSPGAALVRQAGILCDVFQLTVAEAAEALDRSEGEITLLLTDARGAVAKPLGRAVLVVDDEPVVARHLASLAEQAGASRTDIAHSAAEAQRLGAARPPAIVICDYDLGPGPNGAAVVRALSEAHDCVSVFVTAHPASALSGTDGEPAFIIAKPYTEDAVRAALSYAGSAERPAQIAA